MKYDSSVMHKLTNATEQRIVDAYNCLSRVLSAADGVNKADWDDEKRSEYNMALAQIEESFKSAAINLNDYLDHLRAKMAEFENRG